MKILVLFLVLGVLSVTGDSFASDEVGALTRFKEAIFEDPSMVMSNWNALDTDPCGWSGVSCDSNMDQVTKINISGVSLKGFLAPELGQITQLQELILRGNYLIGVIPKELGMLQNLRVLDLGHNQLTGPIPAEIGNLSNAVIINLQSNGLTGTLPPEFGNMKNLRELRLDRNRLQGAFPVLNSDLSDTSHEIYTSSANVNALCKSSQLKVADFSYNFFVGAIPKCLGYLPSTSFQGNCFQNKNTKQRSTAQCGGRPPAKNHQSSSYKQPAIETLAGNKQRSKPAWVFILEVVTGTMVGFIVVAALLSVIHRYSNKSSIIMPWKKSASQKDHVAIYIDTELLKDVKRFSRQDLEVACEDFSNIIGSSSESQVYKGIMKGGQEIAVISLGIKEDNWTGYLEVYFQREVADLARLDHDNTGKLLGYCRERSPFTRMLIFEYTSNGTLYEHLHYGEETQLSWIRRMKIVIGIARGLKYLHTELDPPFTLSELNSSAVYLTDDFSPKLVDFESWKTIIARSERNSGPISTEGPICVLPNVLADRHLDMQGNLYAFGVLLLEIISGRPPFCKDKGSLVDWAKEFLEFPDVLPYVVDPELKHFKFEDLKVVCEVVNMCLNQDTAKRASVRELCSMLETRIDLSIAAELSASSLAWAELALAS